jgi:hypothetical protein
MAERSHWGLHGLNLSYFRAYTALLALRNQGQQDPDWAPEQRDFTGLSSNDGEADEDAVTTIAANISPFDEDRLTRNFLDRLAELVSNIRNGKHVVASVLVETQEGCTVFVAKNSPFKGVDKTFLKTLEESLRDISRTESA